MEFTSVHQYVSFPVRQSRFHRRSRRGAGSCSAGHRDTAASLPYPHPEAPRCNDASELHVRPVREHRVTLNHGAIYICLVLHFLICEYDIVRVADAYPLSGETPSVCMDFACIDGFEYAHIDCDSGDSAAIIRVYFQYLDTGESLEPYFLFRAEALFVKISSYAPGGIAAHHRF